MEPEQKSNGALIGSVIIIIILIIGGIYLWRNTLKDDASSLPTIEDEGDTAAALEAELENLDLDSLDEGI